MKPDSRPLRHPLPDDRTTLPARIGARPVSAFPTARISNAGGRSHGSAPDDPPLGKRERGSRAATPPIPCRARRMTSRPPTVLPLAPWESPHPPQFPAIRQVAERGRALFLGGNAAVGAAAMPDRRFSRVPLATAPAFRRPPGNAPAPAARASDRARIPRPLPCRATPPLVAVPGDFPATCATLAAANRS